MCENFEKVLKLNVRKILRRTILRKFDAIFPLNFVNNLRKKEFENFEEYLCFPKFCENSKEISEKF